jgi:hypothetical protein
MSVDVNCKKCGRPRVLYTPPEGSDYKPYLKCLHCKRNYQKTSYKEKARVAKQKYRQSEKGRAYRKRELDVAQEKCGVRSATTVRNNESKKGAVQRFQRWTAEDEVFLMESTLLDAQLAKKLKRTIRGIQRKRDSLNGKD